ncbi:hypothetical protein ACQ1Q5_04575 [Ornithobacterium rhinotracheale]
MPTLAFSSLLTIVLILFPGIVFRRFYYCGTFSKQFIKGEWAERIIISIFWGLIIQIFSILIFSYSPWINRGDNVEVPISQLFNEDKIQVFQILGFVIENRGFLFLLVVYIFFSIFMSAMLGFLLHKIVRIFNLDIRFTSFRYSNYWHYYFKGELDKTKRGKVALTWVDVTLKSEISDKKKLIQGTLYHYTTDSSNGDLEYLYLMKSKRYSENQKTFKDITGDFFVIPAKNIFDLNIRFKLKDESEKQRNKERESKFYLSFSLLAFISTLLFFILPWIFAKPNASLFKIILSYISGAFCLLFFLIIPDSFFRRKYKLAFISLIISIIFYIISCWLLGYSMKEIFPLNYILSLINILFYNNF